MTLRIRTNGRKRPLYTVAELPHKFQADFSYLSVTDYEPRIVLYKGNFYDVFDCMRVTENMVGFNGWHGYQADSYFSGTLFRLVDDDYVVCGRYMA